MKNLSVILVLVCLICSCKKTDAELINIRHFRDTGKKIGISEIIHNQGFVVLKENQINFGKDSSNHWLKAELYNKSKATQTFYFEIEQPLLDSVSFFLVDSAQNIQQFPTISWATPLDKRYFDHQNFILPIQLNAAETKTIYVKFYKRIMLINGWVRIRTETDFFDTKFEQYGIMGIFAGIMGLVSLFAWVMFLQSKDKVFIYYGFYAFFYLGFILTLTGYFLPLYQKGFLWIEGPEVKDQILWFSQFSILFFVRNYVLGNHQLSRINKILWKITIFLMFSILPMKFLLMLIMQSSPTVPNGILLYLTFAFSSSILCSFYFVVYALIKRINRFETNSYLIGISPLLLIALFSYARNLGFIQNHWLLSQNALIGGIVFDILTLMIGLSIRYRRLQTEKEKQARLAIENELRLYKEKERISRDLHDSVGSQLTIVTTSLDNAVYLAEKQKLNVEKIEKINENVREAVQSLRDTIWVTHLEKIIFADLEKRLKGYLLKAITDSLRFSIDFEGIDPTVELSSAQAINLFRVLQESVQNIIKHASATEILIKCWQENNQIYFVVNDNGKGFDVANFRKSESYGLENMKNRIEEIGGNFEVKSEIAKGTKIKFSFPLA